MAISAARVLSGGLPYRVIGAQKETIFDVTCDNSYPTGGEPIAPSDVGLSQIQSMECQVKSVGGTVNVANVFYDEVNGKLKVYDETPAEAANASDLSTLVVRCVTRGTGSG
jgi:hypothetical protein